MAINKWAAFTDRGNIASTILDSLADATLSAASTALANGTNLDNFAVIEIVLGSLTPTGTAYLELYMVKASDGTNYEDAPTIGGAETNTSIATLPVTASLGAKRVMTGLIQLPPCSVKFYIGNQLNVSMAATGNELNVYTTNYVIA